MLSLLQDFTHFKQLIEDQKDFFVYKYNPNQCPLSDKTKPKVENFLVSSEVEGVMIDVIKQPELKIAVADYLDIPHESPQILCFKQGDYIAHTSHMKIRESWLEEVYEENRELRA